MFSRLFINELHKLFARKRTYIGFGAFLALEAVFLGLLHLDKVRRGIERMLQQNGLPVEAYFSGTTVGVMMVIFTVFFLGSLYLALVSGDIIAKEVEEGTLRMLLCRPVSRVEILLSKALACAVYTATLILFVGFTALLMGLAYRGWGKLLVFSPAENVFAIHDAWPGLARYALAMLGLALTTQTIGALGFFFSCFNMKPAAATILTLSVCFVDLVLRSIPYFESVKHYFLTQQMSVWIHLFDNRIAWERIAESMVILLLFNLTLLLVGGYHFTQRDFKS